MALYISGQSAMISLWTRGNQPRSCGPPGRTTAKPKVLTLALQSTNRFVQSMVMGIKALLMAMVWALLAGCTSLSSGSWVTVAGYANPFVNRDGNRAMDTLMSTLSKNGIEATTLGSCEYIICVSPADTERARKLIAKTIEDQQLKAFLTE